MALRDIGEYHAWIEREQPSKTARLAARSFIAELGDRPWRAPSVPIPELSHQPEYEVRMASLPVERDHDVSVWYLHYYATGDVDLIAVTTR